MRFLGGGGRRCKYFVCNTDFLPSSTERVFPPSCVKIIDHSYVVELSFQFFLILSLGLAFKNKMVNLYTKADVILVESTETIMVIYII